MKMRKKNVQHSLYYKFCNIVCWLLVPSQKLKLFVGAVTWKSLGTPELHIFPRLFLPGGFSFPLTFLIFAR